MQWKTNHPTFAVCETSLSGSALHKKKLCMQRIMQITTKQQKLAHFGPAFVHYTCVSSVTKQNMLLFCIVDGNPN